ncbi:MAG: radical SAM protein [Lachnospiraceae bacterium]|nr:radical SAM protein [Lachnospiraceae bacterium]
MSENEKAGTYSSPEPRMSAYLHSRGAALGLPISGTFELTARCNFNCRMCYVHQNGPDLAEKELTAAEWLEIGKTARDMGMVFLLLTGGEPLLRPDFPEIYTGLVKLGLIVSVNTNASLYNEKIRQTFLCYPPARINVSLYGGSEETYGRLCGNASFEKVVKNLRSMKEDGLQVKLNVSLTPYNAGDMKKIDAISREIGLQTKSTAYMYPPIRLTGKTGENAGRFTAEEAGRVMAEWDALRDPEEEFLRRAENFRQNRKAIEADECADANGTGEGIRCRAGRSAFWMTWDGRLMPCGTMPVEEDAPDVRREGFGTAWKRVREYAAAVRTPSACRGCPDRENCPACAAVCKCETGKFDEKPCYLCEMTRSRIRTVLRIADEMERNREK